MDRPQEGVDTESPINFDVEEATFPGSSRVKSTGTLETTFLVDEDLVPIKIPTIPGN
jgi:hypothetical protein